MLHDYDDIHTSQFSAIAIMTIFGECFAVMSDRYVWYKYTHWFELRRCVISH